LVLLGGCATGKVIRFARRRIRAGEATARIFGEVSMLDYIALGILVFVVITMFYGIIAIHDIPYELAKRRNHPQQDAIHVAGWISLFTLHVLWPFLWIWATLYREDRGWGFATPGPKDDQLGQLQRQLAEVTERLAALESANRAMPAPEPAAPAAGGGDE